MAISDSNPERRNLFVISLAFIVFYAGGAKVDGPSLKLLLVDAEFERMYILAIVAWCLLLWTALRFWQKTGAAFVTAFQHELTRECIPYKLARDAKSRARERLVGAQITDYQSKTIVPEKIWYLSGAPCVICLFKDSHGSIHHTENVPLRVNQILRYTAKDVVTQVVKGNAVQELLLPYVLFAMAVLSPWWAQWL